MLSAPALCNMPRSYEISETPTQNSIKIKGRKNFRCMSLLCLVPGGVYLIRDVSQPGLLTSYACILILVGPQSVSNLERADNFEDFCQPCS